MKKYYVHDGDVRGAKLTSRHDAIYLASEADARIAELDTALALIANHHGKALIGEGRYDEGANAAFNQLAEIARAALGL